MKSILIIGAGKYGHHLAEYLCEAGNDVMLVDKNESLINEYSGDVTTAQIGDFTIKKNIEALGVTDFDYIFVCVGDFQNSLVITDYLKELGAGCVIAKATSLLHEKFLLKNGADKVIYPERDYALRTAVEYNKESIFEFLQLSGDMGVFEILPPDRWIGKTLSQANVRRHHNINVIAYRSVKDDNFVIVKTPDYMFRKDEHILVLGHKDDIDKITK